MNDYELYNNIKNDNDDDLDIEYNINNFINNELLDIDHEDKLSYIDDDIIAQHHDIIFTNNDIFNEEYYEDRFTSINNNFSWDNIDEIEKHIEYSDEDGLSKSNNSDNKKSEKSVVFEDEMVTFNSIQQYFKEINNIYHKNENNYDIVYCSENRDKLIQMNLKTVISIAKKYQGLGLPLEDLISAGNLGLVVAYDKFDPGRSKLKDNIMDAINTMSDTFTNIELFDVIKQYLTYGDIKNKFINKFIDNITYNKSDVLKWVSSNVSNAKFNSIATMWIRAYILIEIDNNSRTVKKPKSEIYKDKEKDGSYKKEIIIDIDAPVNEDSDTCVGDLLQIEDQSKTDLEIGEAYDIFKNGLNQLLEGVKTRDRSIFLKKFGIGLPRPMTPKEIAIQEGLSIARVSQIFQTVIEQMQLNQVKYNINSDILFDAVKKLQ